MLSFLLAAAIQFTPADAKVAYDTARGLVDRFTPRDAGTVRGNLAASYLLDEASAVGGNVRRDVFQAMTPSGEKTFVNLYGEFTSGDSRRWVVLVSHYDTKPGTNCPGANDGASTAGLLVAFSGILSKWEMPHGNVLLVWTDAEECQGDVYTPGDGFHGAKRAAEYLKSKGCEVQAVIGLDMLGDKNLNIKVPANGNKTLAKIAVHAARRCGYPDLVTPIKETVKDDHMIFLAKGFKAIDLIDFDYGSKAGVNDFWHTERDTMDKISKESLLKSGKLVAELLNILL